MDHVLLIEDEDDVAKVIAGRLTSPVLTESAFSVERADCLQDGLEYLTKRDANVVLLDLNLPDSQGFDTFLKVRAHSPETPIVVLTALDDEGIGLNAVRQGAQDYLVKGGFEGHLLKRVAQYAIERHRLQKEIRGLALTDELTGLYNRRGFLMLAEQQLKLAQRTKKESLLVYIDVDGLKSINDTLGHTEGDLAIRQTAAVLKLTFRGSDILARIGGDEFSAFAIETREGAAPILLARLQKHVQELNAQPSHQHLLSLSVGMTRCHPENASSIETLLVEADKELYDQRRAKRAL